MRLLVVGGSDAGISAALRAREDVPDWRRLAHRSLEELEATGMRLLLDHTAHRVDPAIRQVTDPTATSTPWTMTG